MLGSAFLTHSYIFGGSVFEHMKCLPWGAKLRFLLASLSWLVILESPLKLRRTLIRLTGLNKVTDIIFRKNRRKFGEEESTIITKDSRIMYRREDTTTDEKVTVLRLGALTDDNAQDDKVAWGGEEDPFVNLPAVERQEVIKTMILKRRGRSRGKLYGSSEERDISCKRSLSGHRKRMSGVSRGMTLACFYQKC